MENRILHAIEFMRKAHAGQTDKAGNPYWYHPYDVMGRLPLSIDDDAYIAALLHDVIEDTEYTAEDLIAEGFSERTVWLVQQLSRPEGPNRPTYKNWIRQIAASQDKDLIRIKLADLEDNMSPERFDRLPDEMKSIRKRYEWAHDYLTKALL